MIDSMEKLHPTKSTTDLRPQFGKLEFSSIRSFVEDARADHVDTVHLDVFEVSQQSELSFVYYVTLTVFVTAEDDEQRLLYEYSEDVGTVASTDRHCTDDMIKRKGEERVKTLAEFFESEGFDVRHGRLTASRRV